MLLSCLASHGALRQTGAAIQALLSNQGWFDLIAPAAALLAFLVVAVILAEIAIGLSHGQRRLRIALVLIPLVYLWLGWQAAILFDPLHQFGSISTYEPGSSWTDNYPQRPAISYRNNSLGFRWPEITEAKPAGVLRLTLIGDSYVYGVGVRRRGTLSAQLTNELARRWPRQSFEVLNLGLPGNNLASHVELAGIAAVRLEPDVMILALTLPNDLSRWDEQDARRDARRPSLLSLGQFLLGNGAHSLLVSARLEESVTPAGIELFSRQLTRLEHLRPAPLVAAFAFFHWPPAIRQRLEHSSLLVVPDRTTSPADFIPGDGHPTADGNARSAAAIAEALANDARWQEMLASQQRAE
ncbi:MAG TPA: SGNH/GDSL hydrolase family protein [Terriglobales bacterium]|nr:SGNH/GDSL hydrolase family protein [Terriglobales bacterium]